MIYKSMFSYVEREKRANHEVHLCACSVESARCPWCWSVSTSIILQS